MNNTQRAAALIIYQRDYCADQTEYDASRSHPQGDQCFDDWAADELQRALAADGVTDEAAAELVKAAANDDVLSPSEQATINSIRNRGFAVVVFNPTELGDADSSNVEDIMTERGWNAIGDMTDEDVDEIAADSND